MHLKAVVSSHGFCAEITATGFNSSGAVLVGGIQPLLLRCLSHRCLSEDGPLPCSLGMDRAGVITRCICASQTSPNGCPCHPEALETVPEVQVSTGYGALCGNGAVLFSTSLFALCGTCPAASPMLAWLAAGVWLPCHGHGPV